MRRRHHLIACVFLGAASGALGCYDLMSDARIFQQDEGPDGVRTTGTGGGGGTTSTTIDPGCIPSNGSSPVDDSCGVFVSSSKGKDTNEGTKDKPFQTIAKALGAAKAKPVFLCSESFAEPVVISAGAVLYGALDCTKDWTYVSTKRSRIAPAADAIPLRVTSKASLELDDVDLAAADASVPGGSAIALFVEGDTDVMLSRSDLTAGNGAPGTDGALFDMPATAGGDGNPGNDACSDPASTDGGLSVQNTCDADESSSGLGGNGTDSIGGAGTPGLPDGAMNAGAGEGAASCTGDTLGDPGMDGPAGPGASGLGSLTSDGFSGAAGKDGQPGKVAQGGGGGGGAKGGAGDGMSGNKKQCGTVANAPGNAGASGASGGAGGCGGNGGKGGGAGGASIGIASLGAKLTFDTVTVTTTSGGKGGNGGDGQLGGNGGAGAAGGKVPVTATDLKPGCAGGAGGNGGNGGKGGGGLGGPSIGIAFTGDAPVTKGATLIKGTPGEGGTGDGDTGAGAKGVAAETQAF